MMDALSFLHELGSVQYFVRSGLRDRVVINPQWLVDVMTCLISVKESAVVDGRFKRDHIHEIWNDYPKDSHKWLLNLTEEFDLTYYLPKNKEHIVPCLLPEQEPKYTWPELDASSGQREVKFVYKFKYLPAGLFNRAQTRLCGYSDDGVVWKKGVLLHKNNHLGLIRQTKDKEVVVLVQGLRPGNIAFMIHEVLETLINDFFKGVTYDLSVPCVDCVTGRSQDPHMFAAKQIRRAAELNAPFLQCAKLFHIVALVALEDMLPPATSEDYSRHLDGMMHDLNELRTNVSVDLLLLCTETETESDDKHVSPDAVRQKLEDEHLTVKIYPLKLMHQIKQSTTTTKPSTSDEKYKEKEMKEFSNAVKELGEMLTSCRSVAAFVTQQNCSDSTYDHIMHYVTGQTSLPVFFIIGIMNDKKWKLTSLGMLACTHSTYLDLGKPERYKSAIKELTERVQMARASRMANPGANPGLEAMRNCDVFISYCWMNSKDAVSKGTEKSDSALGQVDPRDVYAFLRDEGFKCWLDIHCARAGALFGEIAEGIRNSKILLAFVSDEYEKSSPCMSELQFAIGVHKKPTILAPVGKGNTWQESQIAMIAFKAPRVDPADRERLLEIIHEYVHRNSKDPASKSKPPKGKTPEGARKSTSQTSAYTELGELAQRKFLQQISRVASKLRKSGNQAFEQPFPRLCFIDLKDEIVHGKDTIPVFKLSEFKPQKDRKKEISLVKRYLDIWKNRVKDITPEAVNTNPVSKDSKGKKGKENGNKSDKLARLQKLKKMTLKSMQWDDWTVKMLCEEDGSVRTVYEGDAAEIDDIDLVQDATAELSQLTASKGSEGVDKIDLDQINLDEYDDIDKNESNPEIKSDRKGSKQSSNNSGGKKLRSRSLRTPKSPQKRTATESAQSNSTNSTSVTNKSDSSGRQKQKSKKLGAKRANSDGKKSRSGVNSR